MEKKKVKISYACPIKWDQMKSIDAKSKFCDSCKMKVQDFTKDNDLNIVGTHCGRFRMDQVESINRSFSFNPKQVFVVSLFSLLGMTAPLAAQSSNDSTISEVQVLNQDTITLGGSVRDSTNNEGIPFANIVIKRADGTIIAGGSSDFDGGFKIKVAHEFLKEKDITIEVSVLGYTTKKIDAPNIKSDLINLDITLNEGTEELIQIQVIGLISPIYPDQGKIFNSEDIRESPYRQ